ncbi:MAG: Fe-S cluster assembly protein SufD [Oligoflexus sp.]
MMTENFTHAFEQLRAEADSPAWLDHLRQEGYMRFAKSGLPSLRDEDWKYTSLRKLKERSFQLSTAPQQSAWQASIQDWIDPKEATLVLVNGRFHSWLQAPEADAQKLQLQALPDKLTSEPDALSSWLHQAAKEKDRFLALNQAFLRDGFYLTVAKNQAIRQSLHVIHLVTEEQQEKTVFNRFFIDLQSFAELNLRESFLSLGNSDYFCNPVTQIRLSDGAKLRHQRLQNQAESAIHIDSLYVAIGRDAEYQSLQIDLGAQLARHQIFASLIEKGANLRLDAVSLAGRGQHVDQQTVIDHVVGQTQSSQLYKSVVGSQGRSVFSGQIAIRPDAQQTQAFQLNQNLLLSDDAEADTKPQMIIDADDVRCSHGATVGQLAEDELFYLRSRGIDRQAAQILLVEGFVKDVLRRHPAVSAQVETLLRNRVAGLYGV